SAMNSGKNLMDSVSALKILYVFTVLLSVYSPLRAQNGDTIYFNQNWKECDKSNAKYYRVYTKMSDASYLIEDHYLNGQIQMGGYAKAFHDPLHEFGKYTYYYENGQPSREVSYVDGRK